MNTFFVVRISLCILLAATIAFFSLPLSFSLFLPLPLFFILLHRLLDSAFSFRSFSLVSPIFFERWKLEMHCERKREEKTKPYQMIPCEIVTNFFKICSLYRVVETFFPLDCLISLFFFSYYILAGFLN